jgi:hypothetical protein
MHSVKECSSNPVGSRVKFALVTLPTALANAVMATLVGLKYLPGKRVIIWMRGTGRIEDGDGGGNGARGGPRRRRSPARKCQPTGVLVQEAIGALVVRPVRAIGENSTLATLPWRRGAGGEFRSTGEGRRPRAAGQVDQRRLVARDARHARQLHHEPVSELAGRIDEPRPPLVSRRNGAL